jgi:hypothetical protein
MFIPPPYQLLLRGWMALFGSGELSTRFLSFLFVVLAVLCMAMLPARRSFFFRLVAVGFLGSSPALAVYGLTLQLNSGLAAAISDRELCQEGCLQISSTPIGLTTSATRISNPCQWMDTESCLFSGPARAKSPQLLIPPGMVDRLDLTAKGLSTCSAGKPKSEGRSLEADL